MKQNKIQLLALLCLVFAESGSATNYIFTRNGTLYENWIDAKQNPYQGRFCFEVRADRDAFVMLASSPLREINEGSNIEINLGCCLQSMIQLRSDNVSVFMSTVMTPAVLNKSTFINYCVEWKSANFKLYRYDGTVIFSYNRSASFPVYVIGFRKWFDSGATWKYEDV